MIKDFSDRQFECINEICGELQLDLVCYKKMLKYKESMEIEYKNKIKELEEKIQKDQDLINCLIDEKNIS